MPARSLAEVLEALESLARTGWMLRGVPAQLAETVAQHSFKAAMLAYEIAVRLNERGVSVNPEKATAIALFHDIGEAVIGDIPKTAGIPEAKRRAEEEAVSNMPISSHAKMLVREFEESKTLEALVARIAESLATLLEARRYERLGYNVREIRDSMERTIASILSRSELGGVLERVLEEVVGKVYGGPAR